MRGKPIMVAALTTDMIAATLEKCKIKVEILGFIKNNVSQNRNRRFNNKIVRNYDFAGFFSCAIDKVKFSLFPSQSNRSKAPSGILRLTISSARTSSMYF